MICKDCKLERRHYALGLCASCWYKLRYYRNKDKILKRQKKYYEENRDSIIKKGEKYYEKNKERIKTRQKQRYDNDDEFRKEFLKKCKKYREGNTLKIKQYKKEYMRNPKNREKTNKWTMNNYHSNPLVRQKFRARRRVSRAIKKGILNSPKELNCTDCHTQAEEYHHHKGYEQENWLKVVPKCKGCHKD